MVETHTYPFDSIAHCQGFEPAHQILLARAFNPVGQDAERRVKDSVPLTMEGFDLHDGHALPWFESHLLVDLPLVICKCCPHGLLMHTDFVGNSDEGSVQALLTNPAQ